MLNMLKPSCVPKEFLKILSKNADELKCFWYHRRNCIYISYSYPSHKRNCSRYSKSYCLSASDGCAGMRSESSFYSEQPSQSFRLLINHCQTVSQSLAPWFALHYPITPIATPAVKQAPLQNFFHQKTDWESVKLYGWKYSLGFETPRCLLSSQPASVGRWLGSKSSCRGGRVHNLKRQHMKHPKGRGEKENQSRLKYIIMSDSIVAASPIPV